MQCVSARRGIKRRAPWACPKGVWFWCSTANHHKIRTTLLGGTMERHPTLSCVPYSKHVSGGHMPQVRLLLWYRRTSPGTSNRRVTSTKEKREKPTISCCWAAGEGHSHVCKKCPYWALLSSHNYLEPNVIILQFQSLEISNEYGGKPRW